jgi:predicted lipid-binding transport protein (Tim44 family)
MLKFTHSKGKINGGLAVGALLGAAIPIIATAATGGLAAVPITLWLALGGVVSGLFAGNVERKTPVERALDADAAKISRGE